MCFAILKNNFFAYAATGEIDAKYIEIMKFEDIKEAISKIKVLFQCKVSVLTGHILVTQVFGRRKVLFFFDVSWLSFFPENLSN